LLFRKLGFNRLFEKAQLFKNAQGPLGQPKLFAQLGSSENSALSAFSEDNG
jgi:hypothetical protein